MIGDAVTPGDVTDPLIAKIALAISWNGVEASPSVTASPNHDQDRPGNVIITTIGHCTADTSSAKGPRP